MLSRDRLLVYSIGMFSRSLRVAGFVTTLSCFVAPLRGQSLPIQSVLGATTVSGCSASPLLTPPPSAVPATSESLRDLIGRAQDAALQGDHVAAGDAYARASSMAPAEPRIAYYLGREQEALGDAKGAVQSYCRYLALAPATADADEVRGRVVRLTPLEEIARQDAAQVMFQSAVVLIEHGDYVGADSLLSVTTERVPNAPAAFYNRALARAARGARDSATADFRRYIALTPGGSDHAAVQIALDALPRHVYDPGRAFTNGMLFPGLGQLRTRRPLLGIAALGAMGGAVLVALRWSLEPRLVARRDAAGKLFADSVVVAVYPTAAIGYSAAAAVWVGAALEAFRYARRTRSRSAAIISRGDRGAARLVVGPLSRDRAGLGVGMTWR